MPNKFKTLKTHLCRILDPMKDDNLQRNIFNDDLVQDGILFGSYGVGGIKVDGDHGTLSHLSTICSLLNGFRAIDGDTELNWAGISTSKKLVLY